MHIMIVLKFGGTSVQGPEMIDRALDIAVSRMDRAPVLVSSAMAKVTDALVKATQTAVSGDGAGAAKAAHDIIGRHITVAKDFLSGKNLEDAIGKIEDMRRALLALLKGLALLRECSARSSDAVLAFGELLSTTLIAARAKQRGYKAEFVDSRVFMRTDDGFSSAAPDMKAIAGLAKQKLKPKPGKLIVCQGFIGSTEEGVTTTLGRGGSDYSATIIGAALRAEAVEIWTDVSGILTTDPRLIPGAATIPRMSYAGAAELAYFGAKVMHPSSIQPAVEKGIPVWVKNTKAPEEPGTVLIPVAEGTGPRAIAFKKNITLINVVSSRMLNAYGFLSRMFAVFEKHKTPVDLIATSEVSVSMTVESSASLREIVRDLQEFAGVEVSKNQAILCLVGKNLWEERGFFVRVFSALEGIPLKMISLGASKINLSLALAEEHCDQAVKLLHREFFEQAATQPQDSPR
ncbi:MAG: lysine-sensitive aspartokinase 3 [Spirochaetales bacterium]|jgi:aspartate kinase|nr:lysine-sensitive aspartokinase 3 [Spirochaetales bacterium]